MRLYGLDIARFAAFAGMVLVNFRIVAEVHLGPSWANTIINALEGRAAALFVVLAGIGISLGKPNRRTLFNRALFLFILGMVNYLIFPADILHFYAVYFLFALLLLNASSRMLLVTAAMVVLIGFALLLILDFDKGWDWDTLEYAGFWTLQGFIRNTFFNGFHPVFPWAAFLILGLWVGRLPLGSQRIQLALIAAGVAGAVGSAVLHRWVVAPYDIHELFTLAPIPPSPFYMISSSSSALAVIGLFLWLTPLVENAKLTQWIVKTGRIALTLYIGHIVIGMGILEEFGMLGGAFTPEQLFFYSVGFIIACVGFAVLWSKFVSRGPLEWFMRKIT
jgi:uncharacterized membrane protein YeiB